MNTQHLNELIRLLETIKPINFNLSAWTCSMQDINEHAGNTSGFKEVMLNQLKSAENCGTVCCAIGWACQNVYFLKNGLTLGEFQVPTHLSTIYNELTGKAEEQTTSGFTAIKYFFEFEKKQTGNCLFSNDYYKTTYETTPEQVIERIRELIQIGEDAFLDKYEDEFYVE